MLARLGSRFAQQRMVWWPTPLGWLCAFLLIAGVLLAWTFLAERWLSATRREHASVLVVEGWIGLEGMRDAAQEFADGKYNLIVTTGGLTGERWNVERWNYAEMAAKELRRLGVAPDHILVARAREIESQRTFEAASAARRTLKSNNLEPATINIMTRGPHARRSRLIYAKVFGPHTKVGVISWIPVSERSTPWWGSTDRASDLIKESVAYPFELILNSGRTSNSPGSEKPD